MSIPRINNYRRFICKTSAKIQNHKPPCRRNRRKNSRTKIEEPARCYRDHLPLITSMIVILCDARILYVKQITEEITEK